MNQIIVQSYEIKTSKTQYKVPVVNEVHLHSIYNPIKEAATLIQKHENLLRAKSEVLIFGLGFGYHVQEAVTLLKELYDDQFKVIVIEPNKDVVKDCLEIQTFDSDNVVIYSGEEVQNLYANINLVSFLINKPAVIPHPASFNLYGDYFKSFLTYKAQKESTAICSNIQSETLRTYIANRSSDADLVNMINTQIANNGVVENDLDFLMLAFNNLVGYKSESSTNGSL